MASPSSSRQPWTGANDPFIVASGAMVSKSNSPEVYQNEGSASESSAPEPKKRQPPRSITLNACTNCKKARTKCDGGRPNCARCITRQVHEPCEYVLHTKAAKEEMMSAIRQLQEEIRQLRQQNKTLSERNDILETILQSLKDDTQRQETGMLGGRPRTARPSKPDQPFSPAAKGAARLAAGATTELLRRRKFIIGGCGLLVGFIAYYHISVRRSASQDVAPQDFDFSTRYNATASTFDYDVDRTEWMYGFTKLRKKLIQKAHGNVLEAAVGTGRNSEFYNLNHISSISLQDQSKEMVEIAKAKWRNIHPEYEHCRFITGSALERLPPPLGRAEDEGYDTIVATISLCSTLGPSLFLRNLAGHLSHRNMATQASASGASDSKESLPARILLLEHGRSYFSWLNKSLDKSAPAHAKKYGCWWNRDIGKIIEDSGLEIISCQRKHFGTTWSLELGLPVEAKGENRQQWLEDTRQKIAELQAGAKPEHVVWRARMRAEDEVDRRTKELDAWRREQREKMKKHDP
ncbi:MAG: hypothetical protein Q9182_001409 [Xanthomendoza sp. 2 TL-2023]